MREEAKNWLEQAKEDLATAEANLQIKKYYACALFCQQAAEKALKSLSIEKNRELPKTHNLPELGVKLGFGKDEDLIELNPDYTVSRYPDAANGVPAKMYTAKKAGKKPEAAGKKEGGRTPSKKKGKNVRPVGRDGQKNLKAKGGR